MAIVASDKTKTSKITEKDLAKEVVEWLQSMGWTCYQEVRIGTMGAPIVDIIGVKDMISWAVETKTGFTLHVINQAFHNTTKFHYSSIAIPEPKASAYGSYASNPGRDMGMRICKDYKIGVLTVDPELAAPVREVVQAKLIRNNHEYQKHLVKTYCTTHHLSEQYAQAGSKGGGYFTPYKLMMTTAELFVKSNPGCTIEMILKELADKAHRGFGWRPPLKKSLMSNLDGLEDWCMTTKRKNRNHYYHNGKKRKRICT